MALLFEYAPVTLETLGVQFDKEQGVQYKRWAGGDWKQSTFRTDTISSGNFLWLVAMFSEMDNPTFYSFLWNLKWGCFLFYEEINVQQKVTLSWRIHAFFFQKATFEKRGSFLVFQTGDCHMVLCIYMSLKAGKSKKGYSLIYTE
jgi:hypothetical protein